MPGVTVVITTFNRAHYLDQAIRSALAQTFTDFELLVCDNGGSEETRLLCEGFQDKRIRHIVHGYNMGIAMNTYSGVRHASSDLIAFLNDDDRWTKDFLDKCARPLLDDPDAVLAFSDHWIIDSGGTRLVEASEMNTRRYCRDSIPAGRIDDPMKLLATNSIPLAMASVFRKSAIDWNLYSQKVGASYDVFLAYALLRGNGTVFYISERLTEYRVHGAMATAEFHISNTSASAHINRLILGDPKFAPIAKELRARSIALERHMLGISLRKGSILAALGHLTKMILFYLPGLL
jgi:glycosyltransferase involved in cell wall biosynthesis